MLDDRDLKRVVTDEERAIHAQQRLNGIRAFVIARRRAILACKPFLRDMPYSERKRAERLIEMANEEYEGQVGGRLNLLTAYERRSLGFLVRTHTGFGLWEYAERPDGTIPIEDTVLRRRHYTQRHLKAWHTALARCEPYVGDMPPLLSHMLVQALACLREQTETGEWSKAFFLLPADWRPVLETLVYRCTDRTVASYETRKRFRPARDELQDATLAEIQAAHRFDAKAGGAAAVTRSTAPHTVSVTPMAASRAPREPLVPRLYLSPAVVATVAAPVLETEFA